VFYCKTVLIPHSTLITAPLKVKVPISEGTVNHVWIRWRWGSANLCGCRILYATFQAWPLSAEEWYPSSAALLDFEERFLIGEGPKHLEIHAYNHDDVFSHTVWVGLSILRDVAWTYSPSQMSIWS
jgi:hypothetical protein